MKFDIFGRQVIEVIRSDKQWQAFYCGNNGVKRKANDICIPATLEQAELDGYLADIFHEWATAEQGDIKQLPPVRQKT